MIGHSKKFVFIHIPKTGGTSIEHGLRRYGKVLSGPDHRESGYFKHATVQSIRTHLGASFDNYFKFTFMRDPWDWVVSNYAFNRGLHHYIVAGTGHSAIGRVPEWAQNMPFGDWLEWWIETFNPSQSAMFTDDEGRTCLDTIYRFESLQRDYLRLRFKLRMWDWRLRLPHLKSSKRAADSGIYYDENSRALVASHFAVDIRNWSAAAHSSVTKPRQSLEG